MLSFSFPPIYLLRTSKSNHSAFAIYSQEVKMESIFGRSQVTGIYSRFNRAFSKWMGDDTKESSDASGAQCGLG
jgi:hypothetical protein